MKKTIVTFILLFPVFLFCQIDVPVAESEENETQTLAYQVIEKIPVFPGCEEVEENAMKDCFNVQIRNHIRKHFAYPEEAVEQKIEGKVYVSFVINKEGNVVYVNARGGDPILQVAAQKIFLTLPKIKPGMQRGKPVNVSYTLPINFSLN